MIEAVDGIELARFGEGQGAPIALLHEGLGSVGMWRDFPERLAQAAGREVIAWSRRGYGNSESFAAPYAADFMHREADDAVRLLDLLGIGQAHFFGHSDGASIALLAAARHPARVASLILAAPHVFVEDKCITAIAAAAAPERSADLVARLARYHRDSAAVFRQWSSIWLAPEFPRWDIQPDIAGIGCPTLLIQGEDDEYGTFDQLDAVARILPGAVQLRLPDCRHSPHRDQEAAVLAASAEFLKETVDV